jgi:hypothetical protein
MTGPGSDEGAGLVWEIAQIEVRPGTSELFEEAVRLARPPFERAPGLLSVDPAWISLTARRGPR